MISNGPNQLSTLVIQKSDLLRTEKAADVAKKLGISKSAVSQWGEIIPELSAKKLLELSPELPHTYIEN